jgi:hypothetical protein
MAEINDVACWLIVTGMTGLLKLKRVKENIIKTYKYFNTCSLLNLSRQRVETCKEMKCRAGRQTNVNIRGNDIRHWYVSHKT